MEDARTVSHEEALVRWLAALNRFGASDAVEAAAAPDVVVERYGFADHAGALVERIRGRGALASWMAMSPAGTLFDLPAPIAIEDTAAGPLGLATFRVQLPDFENRGTWRFRLAPDGRVAWLAHHPGEVEDALPERLQEHWQARFEAAPEAFAALGQAAAACAPGDDHDHHDHDDHPPSHHDGSGHD